MRSQLAMASLTNRKLRLDLFGEAENAAEKAERALLAWEKIAKNADWSDWGELKQTVGSADRVGNCVVFDVGKNAFRLIARVMFDSGIIYVLSVMDHKEYDRKDPKNHKKSKWEDKCGCHQPPPKN